MKFKRFSSAALALTMTASLSTVALAEEDVELINAPTDGSMSMVISSNPNARKLVLNGTELDLSAVPALAGQVPMRLVCEADGGYASWFEEDNQGFFELDGQRLFVNFSDLSVEDDDGVLEGVKATLIEGVTYLPVETVNTLKRITAEEVNGVLTVTTSNGLPLTKLARSIIETVDMGCSNKDEQESMKEFMGIDPTWFEEVISYSPFIVQADHVFIGKYAEGVDKEAAQECLKKLQAFQLNSFEHYLPEQYEKAKNAQIVESADGSYVMIVIASNTEAAIAAFQDGVIGLDQANNGIMPR